jgi:hypothetical protein
MTFFELYAVGIPMFAPAPALLARWHRLKHVLHERTWQSALGRGPGRGSAIGRHPNSSSTLLSDPNDDLDEAAVLDWVRLADWYTFPHVTLFSSLKELPELLRQADLQSISRRMRQFHAGQLVQVKTQWRELLAGVQEQKNRPTGRQSLCPAPKDTQDINRMLGCLYGLDRRINLQKCW